MIPGMGGMNPRQMGIKSTEVEALEVIIKKKDGTEMVVSDPQVTIMDIQGQKMLQVSGTVTERDGGPSEDDIKLVADQAGCSAEDATAALKDAKGDIAAAIMRVREKRGSG